MYPKVIYTQHKNAVFHIHSSLKDVCVLCTIKKRKNVSTQKANEFQ